MMMGMTTPIGVYRLGSSEIGPDIAVEFKADGSRRVVEYYWPGTSRVMVCDRCGLPLSVATREPVIVCTRTTIEASHDVCPNTLRAAALMARS